MAEFVDYFRQAIDHEADTFLIDPESPNPRAKHVYIKAGFEYVGDFVMQGNCSGDGKLHHLLVKRFRPTIICMNHITLACMDIDKSFAFYKDVLGLKPLVKWDKGAYFLVGDLWFCLNVDEYRKPSTCYTHYAFTVSPQDFTTVAQRIIDAGAQIFKGNTSPGESMYFLDPDGHKLEIHVGDWRTRIEAKKSDIGRWENVEWFIW